MEETGYITIVCQCKNKHEWYIVLPNFWMSVTIVCPYCECTVESMKNGGIKTLEEIRKLSKR